MTQQSQPSNDTKTKPRPMTLSELAGKYGVCRRTMKKWIGPYKTEIGKISETYIYTTKQIEIIFSKIGEP